VSARSHALLLAALTFATAASHFEASAIEKPAPLIEAAKRGDHAAALELVAQRAGINETEADGTTALHWAARSGDRELVAALLAAGADANAANRYGMTPQHVAAVNGDAATLRTLLAAGADPNATLPEGETVLLSAARTGSPDAIDVLLEFGAKIDARENWYGETPLIWATASGPCSRTVRIRTFAPRPSTGRSAA